MEKLNPIENLKQQIREDKMSSRLGSHATAKALASLTKVGKKQLEELVISAHLWRR